MKKMKWNVLCPYVHPKWTENKLVSLIPTGLWALFLIKQQMTLHKNISKNTLPIFQYSIYNYLFWKNKTFSFQCGLLRLRSKNLFFHHSSIKKIIKSILIFGIKYNFQVVFPEDIRVCQFLSQAYHFTFFGCNTKFNFLVHDITSHYTCNLS